MELVLTEARGGGYRAHRPNCKKIVDLEQFDAEELDVIDVEKATACSSCKPKDVDMEAMKSGSGEADVVTDEDGTEAETVESVDEDGLEPEVQAAPRGEPADISEDDEWDDLDEDLLGDSEGDDLIGDAPAAEPTPPKEPKAKPKAAPKPKAPELKSEEAMGLLRKVFKHLSLPTQDISFPGFGKAVKTVDKQTVYLNSKGTADVRANSPEQAASWVEEGLAERRGGNYVRVNVRDL